MIDASSRAEILGLLRGFQEARDVSYLYITHDLASARHFADRIAVMYLGRVVELAAGAGAHRPSAPSLLAGAHGGRARARPGQSARASAPS